MRPLPCVVTQHARDDLDALLGHIAEQHPTAAVALLTEVDDTLALPADGLLDGRRATLSTGEAVRRMVVRTLVVYYRRDDDALRVLRIHDGRRRPIEREP